jgi:hypothetical protein
MWEAAGALRTPFWGRGLGRSSFRSRSEAHIDDTAHASPRHPWGPLGLAPAAQAVRAFGPLFHSPFGRTTCYEVLTACRSRGAAAHILESGAMIAGMRARVSTSQSPTRPRATARSAGGTQSLMRYSEFPAQNCAAETGWEFRLPCAPTPFLAPAAACAAFSDHSPCRTPGGAGLRGARTCYAVMAIASPARSSEPGRARDERTRRLGRRQPARTGAGPRPCS